jgi:hypothetical protein
METTAMHRPRTTGGRLTVEKCRTLDIGAMQRAGLLEDGNTWEWWLYGVNGPTQVRFTRSGDMLHASFSVSDASGKEVPVTQAFLLLTTPAYFGGVRYWLTCPLDTSCKRLRSLYLPPGAQHFGCRKCYDLAYQSCLVSNRWEWYR